jgi:hypothetical protein
MKKYLKQYGLDNKEQFNHDFITSRNDSDILVYVKDIFRALEILEEVEVLDIRIDTDESQFAPIKNKHQYYKSILPSRLNKIHYKIKITPSEIIKDKAILSDEAEDQVDEESGETVVVGDDNSFIIEKDLYINKLVDNSFYINEGIRYFLIYQIVDNATYGTKGSVSLKSLLMPITVKEYYTDPFSSHFDSTKNYEAIPAYDVLLFSKRISPVLYLLGKYSYNSIIEMDIKDQDTLIDERQNHKDSTLLSKFNKFFGVDIKMSDDENSLVAKGRVVIKLKSRSGYGTFISVDEAKLNNKDPNLMSVLGSLMDMKLDGKKKRIFFTYDDFITPNFWIDKLSAFFTKNSDPTKKLDKIKTMLISLDRLMDKATRKILNLENEDKKNTLTVIRYIMRNFEKLSKEDNQDLDNKRIRLYEYQLYPLRSYFSSHIYRILNSPTRSKNILERIFSNLSPMYIVKQTIVNELLRYYNSTNEMNIYSLLKYTFRGPQSINRTVSVYQRDLHPSYTGRLSLVASSASDPGISGTLVPFIELDNYFFKKQKEEKEE